MAGGYRLGVDKGAIRSLKDAKRGEGPRYQIAAASGRPRYCRTKGVAFLNPRIIRPLVMVFAAAACTAAAAGTVATFDPSPYLAPSQRIDVGGRYLNLFCSGKGSPTVILEAGLRDDMSTWRYVQPAVANETRVCSYDRAGMGFSDYAPEPRDATAVSDDLHRLLVKAGVQPPYVMVGSSLGGLYALLYTERWPADVAALLLVEPSELNPRVFEGAAPSVTTDLFAMGRRTAKCRSEAQQGSLAPSSPNYAACVPATGSLELFCQAPGSLCSFARLRVRRQSAYAYLADFDFETQAWLDGRTEAQILANRHSLGTLPMTVLTGAKTFDGAPANEANRAQQLWIAMHQDLAALSAIGKESLIGDSGHVMQFDDPDAIISAIRSLIDAARQQ